MAMPQTTIPALCSTINAHLTKARQCAEKSEQHYISAGLHLKELKARKNELKKNKQAIPWPDFVQEKFGLGRSRADELIRIADGRTTVEKVRTDTVKRVQANRARSDQKSPLRNGDFGGTTATGPRLSEFQRTDGQVKPACDFNAEDAGDVAEPGDSEETIRHRIFMHHASEALRHARENGLDKAAASEITDDVIAISLQAAEAWSALASQLQQRAQEERNAA